MTTSSVYFGWIFLGIYYYCCFDVIYCDKFTTLLPSSADVINKKANVNPCLNPETSCFNGGSCIVASENSSTVICICNSGYTGQRCENKIKARCTKNVCSNGGSCFIGVNSITECVCPTGYAGQLCEITLNENCPILCPNDSVCINSQCECRRGSAGNPGSCKSDPCSKNTCLNGATCLTDEQFTRFTCSCAPGFSGNFCQIRPQNDLGACKKVQCPLGQRCINRGEIVSCVPDETASITTTVKPVRPVKAKLAFDEFNITLPPQQTTELHFVTSFPLVQTRQACPPETCLNGGTCVNDSNVVTCKCRQGFTGLSCENDLDECILFNPCKHGVCQNQHGSYQCYCRPGYMGANCTDDFDECYSNPCKNDGTCINTMGSYDCLCTAMFTGVYCENKLQTPFRLLTSPSPPHNSEICSNITCYNGGTCMDNLVGYQCLCPAGFSGLRCNETIPVNDPCSSNPCGGGQCLKDESEFGYSCICDESNSGTNCGSSNDLCARISCLNSGSCNVTTGYCNCPNGFSGKTCEIQFNQDNNCNDNSICLNGGTCRDRSTPKGASVECICPVGFSGLTCEILPQPKKSGSKLCATVGHECANGATCIEVSGSTSCLCMTGYTGRRCENEIDQCFSGTTKVCGSNAEKCVNVVGGGFRCICREPFGGPFCNVSLAGCAGVTCGNGQICKPTLDFQGLDSHICQCPDGRTGDNCADETTVSFGGNSLMAFVTSTIANTKNYSLNFRFKTTVSDSVLVSGDSIFTNNFYLSLKSGRIRCMLKNQQELKLRSVANDGLWYDVILRLNTTHAVLSLGLSGVEIETQSSSMANTFQPIFTTKFGGPAQSQIAKDFTGCMQNIVVDNHNLIPKQLQQNSMNVKFGCQRVEQCKANSCSGNGKCVDLWSSHQCVCKRPYLSPNCATALPEATFGFGSNRSFADIQMNSTEKQLLAQNTDFSALIRTRSANGVILYVGSAENGDGGDLSDTFIGVQLENGKLKCSAKLGQQTPMYFTGGTLLNDGVVHLIRVSRVGGVIEGFVDDVQVFSGQIPGRFVYPLFPDLFLIGGFPAPFRNSTRSKRVVGDVRISRNAFTTDKTFKGTIQDPRINDMLILMSPTVDEDSLEMELFGFTDLKNNVLQGTVSDDTCKVKPCLNDGRCFTTFNDFNCSCAVGWRGKTCSHEDYCLKNPCEDGSECKNLEPDGFVCLTDVTFSNASYAHFSLANVNSTDIFYTVSLKIRTRDKNGMIFFMDDGTLSNSFLSLEIVDGGLNVAYSLGTSGTTGQVYKTVNAANNLPVNDGIWHKLKINLLGDQSYLEVDNETNVFVLQGTASTPLSDLFSSLKSRLYVGSLPQTLSRRVNNLHSFKGCLSDIVLGVPTEIHSAFPISFVKSQNTDNFKNQHFKLEEYANFQYKCHGDPVCDQKCKNGATCVDLFDDFRCDCILGFEGNVCEINIDDCEHNRCQNNASCVDGIANYTCACHDGTTGQFCEIDIDECASAPCMNHGTCSDLRNGYQCACNEDYTGKHCEFSLLVDCDSNPCLHKGQCSDVKIGPKKSFNCTCHPSYFGQFCENEVNFCERTPCHSNGTCVSHADTQDVSCTCQLGFEGKFCETNIDDCQSHPCVHGDCVDGVANFTCHCHQGWRGVTCNDDVDECLSSPCLSKSTCVNSEGNFTCHCPKYYLGEFCEIEGGCLKSPCLKGECDQISATALRCLCPYGYTGQFCEAEINFCDSNPCSNGANCTHFVGGYSCQCRSGFTGVNCETNINECGSNPCQNKGVCIDDVNKFNCNCNGTGYSGDLCQHDIDECNLGGYCIEGTCRNLIGTYNCSCNHGYVGPKCNFKDPCSITNGTFKCKNGGKCNNPKVVELENRVDYDCLCSKSFVGDFCETPRQPLAAEGPPLVYIIAPIVGFVLLVCLISCIAFVMVARKKRATRGTYSPSRQEMTGARVQMGAMMKPPPEERLI